MLSCCIVRIWHGAGDTVQGVLRLKYFLKHAPRREVDSSDLLVLSRWGPLATCFGSEKLFNCSLRQQDPVGICRGGCAAPRLARPLVCP